MSRATRNDNLRHAHSNRDSHRRRQQHPFGFDIFVRSDSFDRPLDITLFVPELSFVPPVASRLYIDDDNTHSTIFVWRSTSHLTDLPASLSCCCLSKDRTTRKKYPHHAGYHKDSASTMRYSLSSPLCALGVRIHLAVFKHSLCV